MSNKAKSVFFKLLSFACCVVPPVIVMIQNGCFEPKNANAFQRLGIIGVALAIVVTISGSRYLREFIDIASFVFKKRGEAEEKEQK